MVDGGDQAPNLLQKSKKKFWAVTSTGPQGIHHSVCSENLPTSQIRIRELFRFMQFAEKKETKGFTWSKSE